MITVSLPDAEAVDFVERAGGLPDDVRLVVWNGLEAPPAGADAIEFFVGRYDAPVPSAETLAGLRELRAVQVISAGVDAWLPVLPDGVVLCNGRGIHGVATAELAVAGLLAVVRRIPGFVLAQQRHEWDRHQSGSLEDSRVMVIGAGDIGNRIAAAVRVFDAETTMVARSARDGVHAYDELSALLPEHDVVVLALPFTAETRHLVGAGFLAAMPDGAVLVNISRGPIVDTDALLTELTAGRLRAFLDVTDPEPLPGDHPLWGAPNVLITPHVGGGVRGWQAKGYALVREQILRLRDGEPLVNRVGDEY